MIKVDNSYKTRLFTNKSNSKIEDLKTRVANKILEIEEGTQNYNELATFENEKYTQNISVFYYKKKIEDSIDSLVVEIKDESFKRGLRNLKLNLFKVLTGNFETMKHYLTILNKNSSKLIHRGKSTKKSKDFKRYQEYFENLYKSQLSGSEKFKLSLL